jgi:hypothetical protein
MVHKPVKNQLLQLSYAGKKMRPTLMHAAAPTSCER